MISKLRIKKVFVNRYGERVKRYKPFMGAIRLGNSMGYRKKTDALAVGKDIIKFLNRRKNAAPSWSKWPKGSFKRKKKGGR
jgi:cytochrome c-type biogenesis protein CcmH/NrfF